MTATRGSFPLAMENRAMKKKVKSPAKRKTASKKVGSKGPMPSSGMMSAPQRGGTRKMYL